MVLLSQELMPPETIPEGVEKEKQPWRTEYDVISTLKSMGHEVYPCGLRSDLEVIAKAREENKPQIVFNLLEDFEGQALYDQHVVSYLELNRQGLHAIAPRLFGDTALHEIPLADTDHGAAFGRMWEDYARGILDSVPTRQTGEDGKRAVEIVQAAYRSNATGKTVDLPLSID